MPQYNIFSINIIQVEFLGEEGEDGGGLLREFWTLLFKEIKNSLFDGSDDRYVPRHDVIALQVPFKIYVFTLNSIHTI